MSNSRIKCFFSLGLHAIFVTVVCHRTGNFPVPFCSREIVVTSSSIVHCRIVFFVVLEAIRDEGFEGSFEMNESLCSASKTTYIKDDVCPFVFDLLGLSSMYPTVISSVSSIRSSSLISW